jgi:anaerobic selenocysteine-containing dehydrogenase
MCGLEIQVEDGRVAGIRGNREDSRGHLCPKCARWARSTKTPPHPDADDQGGRQEVSWDTAFLRCTEPLAPVIAEHGIGAVTCYTDNPLAHSFSPVSYSPGTVDQWPKNLSSHLM